MRLKWRNLAVFVFAFGAAMAMAHVNEISPAAALILFGMGVWPCAVVVRLGWLES